MNKSSQEKSQDKKTEFISRPALAERWNVSIPTLQRYEKKGKLRPVKLGERLLRYRFAEVTEIEAAATLDRKEVTA